MALTKVVYVDVLEEYVPAVTEELKSWKKLRDVEVIVIDPIRFQV